VWISIAFSGYCSHPSDSFLDWWGFNRRYLHTYEEEDDQTVEGQSDEEGIDVSAAPSKVLATFDEEDLYKQEKENVGSLMCHQNKNWLVEAVNWQEYEHEV